MTHEQPDADDDTASACERMPYEEITEDAFGQQAATTFDATRAADDTYSVVGRCPRCGASMEVVIPGEMFLANRSLLRRRPWRTDSTASPRTEEVPMSCLCSAPHPGRPQDRKGCGAYWKLIVEGQS
jgi:hypothetical protein